MTDDDEPQDLSDEMLELMRDSPTNTPSEDLFVDSDENVIVRDGKMGGQPRLDGRRITVQHVVTAVQDFGGIEEAAEQLRIEEHEVQEALEWVREHSDV